MKRWIAATLALTVAFAAAQAQAARLALVIGNADYSLLEDLDKTLNDSAGYRDALATLGFDVSYHTDLDRAGFDAAVASFLDRTRPGDETVFVYAGHGWSDGRTNYLLPTDTPARGSPTMLSRWSIPLKNGANGLLDEIAQRGARLQVSVIDACRNNPFKAAGNTRAAGRTRGLTLVSPPRGAFVIYSAGTGEEALDDLPSDGPAERYSVFTRTFLPLLESGIPLEKAIGEAQVQTAALAGQIGHRQNPAYYDETLGETCLGLNGCKARPVGLAVKPPPVQPARPAAGYDPAKVAYEDAKARGTRAALEAVAKFYPDTYWGTIATQEAAALTVAVPLPPPPVTPEPAALPQMPSGGPSIVTRCDRLAGARGDPDLVRNTKGIRIAKIDTTRAVAACDRDVVRYPESRRQLTALGRALVARKRYGTAFDALTLAADRGSIAATAELGWLYYGGDGVAQNQTRARALFAAAAAQDIPAGLHGLGVMVRDRDRTREGIERAIDLLERAAEMNYAPAVTELGRTYADGLGTPIDNAKASTWLNRGISLHDPTAITRFARMYADGQGERRNGSIALSWFKQSYDAGDRNAALYIGDLYRDGNGVPQSNRKARAWYLKARSFGLSAAKARLETVPRRQIGK